MNGMRDGGRNDGWPVIQQWSVFVQMQTDKMIRTRYCNHEFTKISIFSLDRKPNNGKPIEQSKSNPWHLIFVPFLTNNSQHTNEKNVIFRDAVARGPNS